MLLLFACVVAGAGPFMTLARELGGTRPELRSVATQALSGAEASATVSVDRR